MNIYITLDYELFFGASSGTAEDCIIKPTQALLNIVEPYGIKFTCFVDSGYLLALEKYKADNKFLQGEYEKVTRQIKYLSQSGHGIELHIHPHWEDSIYENGKWIFDTSRYRLSHFSKEAAADIVTRYTDVLKRITDIDPVAYRAGGWSAQPFGHIKDALKRNGVTIDSTVFPNGYHESDNQKYDFRNVPQYVTEYKFSNDLTLEDSEGEFTEIPISSTKVAPFFFWKFALAKMLKQNKHVAFGNGGAIAMPKRQLLRLMLIPSYTVVSIDGYKSNLIQKSFRRYKRHTSEKGNFVLIGHPKAFTPYSLNKLNEFLANVQSSNNFKTFR